MEPCLTIWTIYDHPRDVPDKWVLREHDIPGGAHARYYTLDEVRAMLPPGLHRLPRSPRDDPVVVESWV